MADELPPAGWYPDPDGGGRRYWDGAQWGPKAPDPPTATRSRPPRERGFIAQGARFGGMSCVGCLTFVVGGIFTIAVIIAVLSGGSDNHKAGTPTTSSTATSSASKSQFLACLKAAQIQVVPSGDASATQGAGSKGRVPIDTPVPAEYLGATVLPHGGYFDLWLATDATSAKKAATALNRALSKQVGSTVEAASSRGLVVNAAPANVGIVSLSDAHAIDRCTDRL